MKWLPPSHEFRRRFAIVHDGENVGKRLEELADLANSNLSYLEVQQVDAALSRTGRGRSRFDDIRLAVLAASTVDHLLPSIRVAGLRRGLRIQTYASGYGQHRQEASEPTPHLSEFRPDVVLFSLVAREFIGATSLTASAGEADRAIASAIEDLRAMWSSARQRLGAVIIQQSFLDVEAPVFGGLDSAVAGAPARLVQRLNAALCDAAQQDGVLLLDIARASARDGLDAWFDNARWLHAKMEIAPQAAPTYGDLIARLIAAARGKSKKCLVLDLDNTVWGGVVGDDGIEGIQLGEGSAVGEAHLALQRYAKQLSERGIILAICSKNDPATAEAAFRDHPEMILKRSDIAAFVANWDDKAENLKLIAKALNIGIDSLVFVDDNPVERARIRESLPMVAVPELPEDVAYYVPRLADAGYFEAVAFTAEDRHRTEQYAANTERDALLSSSQSMEEFLRGLKMEVVFGPFAPVNLTRVTQLLNKTNQFNTTTRRYATEELVGIAAASGGMTLQFRLLDRFGDNGIVSAIILSPDAEESGVLQIDNWVMSCRVFGRELEHEIMNIVVEAARGRGARAFRADYIPTSKNSVISELFSNLGFDRPNGAISSNGATRWFLSVEKYVSRKTHISRRVEPR